VQLEYLCPINVLMPEQILVNLVILVNTHKSLTTVHVSIRLTYFVVRQHICTKVAETKTI
jgi:hypothetical protein